MEPIYMGGLTPEEAIDTCKANKDIATNNNPTDSGLAGSHETQKPQDKNWLGVNVIDAADAAGYLEATDG